MQSAIIINLDYESHDSSICKQVWAEIDTHMQDAGFAKHKRLFITNLDRDSASKKAKTIIDAVEDDLEKSGILVFDIISEFYCFSYQQMNDLLDPSHHTPEVSFMDTGSFPAFVVNSKS